MPPPPPPPPPAPEVIEIVEDEEEVEIFAQVDLDLTGLENVVTKFWVATVATGEMKHVKLYLKLSVDGGLTFGPKILMGTDERGFQNIDTAYKDNQLELLGFCA